MKARFLGFTALIAVLALLSGCVTAPSAPPPEAAYTGPVYAPENVDVPPDPTYQIKPTYPASLLQANQSGWAIVEFVVTPQGRIADLRVTQSSDPAFAESAKNAILRWTYNPALKHGQPVACRLTVPLNFPHPR